MRPLTRSTDSQLISLSILQISLENSVDGIANVLHDSRHFRLLGGTQTALGFLLSAATFAGDTTTEINETKSENSENLNREEEEDKFAAFTIVSHVGDREVMDDENEMTVERELDEQIQDAAQDLWEDTRVISRKVIRHAKNALRTMNIENEDTQRHDSPAYGSGSQNTSSSANTAGEHRNISSQSRPTGAIPDETSQRKVTTGPDTASSEIVRSKQESIRFVTPDGISYEVPLNMVSKWEVR